MELRKKFKIFWLKIKIRMKIWNDHKSRRKIRKLEREHRQRYDEIYNLKMELDLLTGRMIQDEDFDIRGAESHIKQIFLPFKTKEEKNRYLAESLRKEIIEDFKILGEDPILKADTSEIITKICDKYSLDRIEVKRVLIDHLSKRKFQEMR